MEIDIQNYLKDLDYPATKQDIVDKANEHEAPDTVMDKIDRITEKEYVDQADLNKELGQAK